MLKVITPATSQDLATLAVVKAALGITGNQEDATLTPLITRASVAIATACNRVLVEETIEETFTAICGGVILDRYPVTSLTSLTDNGTALVPSDFDVDTAAGIVERVDGQPRWARGRAAVRYVAGYNVETMPGDIVQALVITVAHLRSQAARDPLLRAEETRDVERLEWQIGGTDGLPGTAQALLEPHRKPAGA